MKGRFGTLLLLHLLMAVYSCSGILSKLAASEPFFSWKFCVLYAGIIFLLGLYAVGWQQILKRLPLTTAFSNKAITIVWGIVWGALLFSEPVTFGKLVGASFIIVGVALFVRADVETSEELIDA